MRSSPRLLAALAVAGVVGWGLAAPAQGRSAVTLLRCRPDSPAICAQTVGKFPPSDADDEAPVLRLGRADWSGPDRFGTDIVQPPTYLLVLLDVSGSMSGFGIAHTRAPLRSFIGSLPASTVRVAVAPFGSRGVLAAIRGSRFTTPAGAVRQLDAIPAPEPSANTALYSAVRAGAEVLAGQSVEGIRIRRMLLVVTDGVNEVGPRDDPGLLANDGLPTALDEVSRSEVDLLMLGLGEKVGRAQLDSLAAGSGRSYISQLNQLGVAEQLGRIRGQIADRTRLTFASGADPASLGRIVRRNELGGPANGSRGSLAELVWRPPLMALPALTGVASDSLGSETAAVVASAVDWRLERLVYASVLAIVMFVLWLAVPRWLWPPTVMEREVVRERTEGPKGAQTGEGTLRLNVREAPPRLATDVTGEFPAVR